MSIRTVFLSSTARDLAEYRQAATEAINGLDGYKCVRMEDFGARDWEADDFCRAKVAGCDLFVGVVGHLYGSCPEGSEHSYTEREYEAAIAAGMPRLMFIAPENFPLPASLIEPDEKRRKQRAFRDRVNAERIRDEFTSPDDLARRVVQAIRNWEQEQAALEGELPTPPAEIGIPLPPQSYFDLKSGSFDDQACEATLYDIDEDAVRLHVRKAAERGQSVSEGSLPLQAILEELGLYQSGFLTRAAILLFGKNPQRMFPQAKVRCGRFKGLTLGEAIDELAIEGTLLDQVADCERFILRNIRKGWIIEGFERREQWEYPIEAIREALVNAIVHRDYHSSGNVQVRIFDDRIEILSPGCLPEPLMVADLLKPHLSYPRNQWIAECFHQVGLIEQWGSGFRRILDSTKSHGLPEPNFSEETNKFVVVLKGPRAPLFLEPYIAYPYPSQEHFTGREQERSDLAAWLTDDAHPLLAVIAIGGMGKSALGWHWLQEDLLPLGLEHWGLHGVLWWCFYDRESGFERFLERAIAYVSGGEMDAADWPVRDRMDCLRALLAEHPFLLMLDGVERLLRAYARMDAPYLGDEEVEAQRGVHPASLYQCADPNVGIFLQWLAGLGATKTLLTSRLLPRELEGLAGVARRDLKQMDPEDAVRFFRAMDIQGTRAEIQASCAPYGYLPLALRLLAGLVAEDPARPGDIAVVTDYEITEDLLGKEQHHILERAYDVLDPAARELLSRMAAFRSPVGYGAVRALFSPPSKEMDEGEEGFRFESERALKDALRGLVKRGLLSRQEGTGHYDLHPVVRRYAYERLADKEGTHARLRDYFAAVPAPERVESLDDLAPLMELYHHTVRAGRYDEAFRLFRDKLDELLYFRFGTYQLIIELLRALFPGGEPFTPSGEAALPILSRESDQGWTLNRLAQSYAMSGQPSRAVPSLEAAIALEEKQDNKRNLAISLMNIATQQLAIGALTAAEGNLQRDIKLTREIDDKLHEAVGHLEMGRLLLYTGAFEEAGQELETALEAFEEQGGQQSMGGAWAYRALRALLMGRMERDKAEDPLPAAREARELANVRSYERDIVQAEWLLGAAHRAQGELPQAESHLGEALRRCRRINLVEVEPDILLELARLRHAQAQEKVRRTSEVRRTWEAEALSLAQEALDIADRCQYRLVQADCHNFLAELALEAGDRQKAQEHAETARERAWCDGPPHRYEAAFQEAERLLERIASDAERARGS
jgi:tetratricopeptide (TPR) repeat protein